MRGKVKLWTKLVSFVTVAVLLITTVPRFFDAGTNVAAAGGVSNDTITTVSEGGGSAEELNPGGVKVVKKVTPTSEEGVYEVTFDVTGKDAVDSTTVPVYVVVVFDRSRSMADWQCGGSPYAFKKITTSGTSCSNNYYDNLSYPANNPPSGYIANWDKWNGAVNGAKAFATTVTDNISTSQIALVAFSTASSQLRGFRHENFATVDFGNPDGGTNLATGLAQAKTLFDTVTDPAAKKILVILGDGDADDKTGTNGANNRAAALKTSGVEIFSIGYEISSAGETYYKNTISTSASHYYAADADSVATAFNNIGNSINVPAGTGAVLTDVIGSDFTFVGGSGSGATNSGGTVTCNVGTITETGYTCSFKIRINPDLPDGNYATNGNHTLTYKDVDDNDANLSNNATPMVNWIAPTVGYTVNYYVDEIAGTPIKIQAREEVAKVGTPVNISGEYAKANIPTGYKYVSHSLSTGTGDNLTLKASGNVVNVIIEKDDDQKKELSYTVKYYVHVNGVETEMTTDEVEVSESIWVLDPRTEPYIVKTGEKAPNVNKYTIADGWKFREIKIGDDTYSSLAELPETIADGGVIEVHFDDLTENGYVIELECETDTQMYTGSLLTFTSNCVVTNGPTEAGFEIGGLEFNIEGTDVGTYFKSEDDVKSNLTITYYDAVNDEYVNVKDLFPNSNITITQRPQLTITPSNALTIIDATGYTGEYDNTNHNAVVSVKPSVTEGTIIEYSIDGVNWGTTVPTVKDVADTKPIYIRAKNPNYVTTEIIEVQATVTKRPAKLVASDASKVYGTNDPAFNVTQEGFLAVHQGIVKLLLNKEAGIKGVRPNVGIDETVGTYTDAIESVATQGLSGIFDNYDIEFVKGDFRIIEATINACEGDCDPEDPTDPQTGKDYDAVIVGDNKTYDGNYYKVEVYLFNEELEILEWTKGNKDGYKDAGDYRVCALIGDVAGNYTPKEICANVVITPRKVTIKPNDAGKYEKEVDPALKAQSIDGLVDGDEIKYTLTREPGETAGRYKISCANITENSNYTITCVTAVFTILSLPIVPPVTPPVVPPTPNPIIPQPTFPAIVEDVDDGEVLGETDVKEKPVVRRTDDTDDKGEVLGDNDQQSWALLNLILAIVTALISIILLIGYLGKDRNDEHKRGLTRLLSLVPAIGAFVVFFLTEDWTLPMVWVDMWTILMAVILVAQIVLVINARRDGDDEEDEDEPKNAKKVQA